ncbi:hypothetical protein EVAR_57312_1 [Eumeta japonica]|uniref:PiggyBac transposable element-derived protein domain-containing protein n=1 Tax=Eumeta variegata TaxID=151549 RepID=A0A4C1ZLU0_EUMVA|nr:hypothetical protein EVAR_57312_1 [Eumeta japonica]
MNLTHTVLDPKNIIIPESESDCSDNDINPQILQASSTSKKNKTTKNKKTNAKEEFLAVDEQIIPTKCRHEIKQYNPAKPHKWGFKNQVLSGVSGFSYDFDIFAGEQSDSFPSDAPNLGVSSNVVTRLTSTVSKHQNYKICFDNWFNSPNLQVYLLQNGLLPLGTVRLNRVPNSDMPTEKELKKEWTRKYGRENSGHR